MVYRKQNREQILWNDDKLMALALVNTEGS